MSGLTDAEYFRERDRQDAAALDEHEPASKRMRWCPECQCSLAHADGCPADYRDEESE